MPSRLDPLDLGKEARNAETPAQRRDLVIRLLGTGEWVHGVTAGSLAVLWSSDEADVLRVFDQAIGSYAASPGAPDALRGLAYARLSHIAERAMAHQATIVTKSGEPFDVPSPQFAAATAALSKAFEIAIGGAAEDADDSELDRLMAEMAAVQARKGQR